jgi:hypothetical protein
MLSCVVLPVGVGDHMHVCGTVVDEDLKPIQDPLTITTRVQYPIMVGMGEALKTESQTTTTNGKFCVDAYNAWEFTAFVGGNGIRANPISSLYNPVNLNGFKWVVERNTKMGKRPNFDARHLLRAGKGENIGYSLVKETVLYHRDRPYGFTVDPLWIRNIVQHGVSSARQFDSSDVIRKWNALRPNTLVIGLEEDHKRRWDLLDPEAIADFHLLEIEDRVYIVPGPLVKTKFIAASLDSPVCTFGRMPGPPPLEDGRWTDTLHVAIHNALLFDAFYVYSPESQRWGKFLLKPEVTRDSDGVQLQFVQVTKPISDTSSFLFWRVEDRGFQDRQKCLTKVEAYRAMPEYKGVWEHPGKE